MANSPTVFPKLRQLAQPLTSRVQDAVDIVLRPAAQSLGRTPIMGATPVWTAMQLVSGISNAGGGLAAAAHYLDSFMRVWVKGVVANMTGGVVAAGSALNAGLPMGLRPRETQRFAVEGAAATLQFVSLSPLGILSPEVALAPGDTIDLGLSFLAEQ